MRRQGKRRLWIAPATLVFENAVAIQCGLTVAYGDIRETSISVIDRTEKADRPGYYSWRIETDMGEVTFDATGFTQYLRQAPIHVSSQPLEYGARGGVSLDRKPYEEPSA